MGNLVNPVILRLKSNIFWNSTWVTYKYSNYSYLLSNDFLLFNYIEWFIKNKLILFRKKKLFLNYYKIIKYNNKVCLLFIFWDKLDINDTYKKKYKSEYLNKDKFLYEFFFLLKKKRNKFINLKKKLIKQNKFNINNFNQLIIKKNKYKKNIKKINLLLKLFFTIKNIKNLNLIINLKKEFYNLYKNKQFNNLSLYFYKENLLIISSSFLVNVLVSYINNTLVGTRVNLKWIVNLLVSLFYNNNVFYGWKIGFLGKFKAGLRTKKIWYKIGKKMSLNSYLYNIDYFNNIIYLKSGVFSIKLYIMKKLFINYNLERKYDNKTWKI